MDGDGAAPQRVPARVARQREVKGRRPERQKDAEAFYNSGEAARYETNARMAITQRHLASRALHLLHLPSDTPSLLLDIGCGTGYSGGPLEKAGHAWLGLDISLHMLAGARAPHRMRDVLGADIGTKFGLRKGIFDGAVSISAVQWLCFATKPEHVPHKRVRSFFKGLRHVLRPGARAVLQFYPEEPSHLEMLRSAAVEAEFTGGLVVDYPRSERSKKLYLVLVAPQQRPQQQQKARKERGGAGGGAGAHWQPRPSNRRERQGREGRDPRIIEQGKKKFKRKRH